jgi:hypothetical protein
MSQSLEVNIKTTSDVPQAMDKAKSATVSMAKQLEDIKKKFSTSLKDIFLSVAGPMALFNLLQQKVTDYFEAIKRKQDEANQSAIDGTNKKMAAEDVYYARKIDNLNKERLASQQAAMQPEQTAKEFILNDPRAQEVLGSGRPLRTARSQLGGGDPRLMQAEMYAKDKAVQDAVRRIIAQDLASEPPKADQMKDAAKNAAFKGPEGFGNVIGVGANPVMEAMSAQLEETQKTNSLLQNLVDRNPFMSSDFTKQNQTK